MQERSKCWSKKETPTRRCVRIPKGRWPIVRRWRCGSRLARLCVTRQFGNDEQRPYNWQDEDRENPFPRDAENGDPKKDSFIPRDWIRRTLF